jgi:hypothetical protein
MNRTRRGSLLIAGLAAIALVASVGPAQAKKPKPKLKTVGAAITFTMSTPDPVTHEGTWTANLTSPNPVCVKHRFVELLPVSDNFPNISGYSPEGPTSATGAAGGTYSVPKKADTYVFTAETEKVIRKLHGKRIACAAVDYRAVPNVSVTTDTQIK